MKKILFLIFSLAGLSIFAQTNARQIAPGAQEQFKSLLNTPTMVRPVSVIPLGKNWFKLEMDAHVFTDQVSVQQVAAVLLDLENQEKFFDGKKSKLGVKVVSRRPDETLVDFVSISIGPLNIRIKTPYRASVRAPENTAEKFLLEIKQLDSDSAANNDIKNLLALRYAEAVTIDGAAYTYIRIYSTDEANASILPGAKGVLEKDSGPANIEALEMIIAAAKTK